MTHPSNAVYLALGPLRTVAAREHAARLVALGARVALVIADVPQWGTVPFAPGVTVHRVSGRSPGDSEREARRLLSGRHGLLRDADLLIAGDPPAFPVAWWAARRRPDLEIALEPSDGRRTAPAELTVVTPWYPGPNDPLAGAFVQTMVGAVREHVDRVSVLHAEHWAFGGKPRSTVRLTAEAVHRLAPRTSSPVVVDRPEGELTRVAVPLAYGRRAPLADARVQALRAALPTGRIESPLIHAHTGIFGGVMAMRLARADARIIVTEHASFLPEVFAEADACSLYEQVLDRADLMLCVSGHVRRLIAARFPRYEDKLLVLPNVVDFDAFLQRAEPPREPLRWLYLGRLLAEKGVLTLVDGFARIAAEEPRATLTIVGSGDLEAKLRARIGDLRLADRIDLRPAVSHHEVAGVMHQHDLLVHASRFETFGMTVVEAIATGMPVLVARSTGPAETMAGLEGKAGELVEVSGDPEVLADGYRRLRDRFSHLDLPGARAELRARYGRAAVAARLLAAYRAEDAPRPSADPAPSSSPQASAQRVVVVAIRPRSVGMTIDVAHRLLGQGFEVDLITESSDSWRQKRLDTRVRLHPVGAAEDGRLWRRAERQLIHHLPSRLLTASLKPSRRLRVLWPAATVSALQRLHTRVADKIENALFNRLYQVVRPRALWRIARREVLPHLAMSRTRAVVVAGATGVVIGRRLARRYPDVEVTISMAWSADAQHGGRITGPVPVQTVVMTATSNDHSMGRTSG